MSAFPPVEPPSASASAAATNTATTYYTSGVYTWSYAGGSFEVSLRPNSGVFYSEKFPSAASYAFTDGGNTSLTVDWKKYGRYTFRRSVENPMNFEGFAEGNEANWRKMEFKRPFSAMETTLFGDNGLGTSWNWSYEGGVFEVIFMTDGYNHFSCPKYPAHSHWKMLSEGSIEVNWGKYGDYIINFDDSTHLSGHKKDAPANWRRCVLNRSITAEDKADSSAHAHAHDH